MELEHPNQLTEIDMKSSRKETRRAMKGEQLGGGRNGIKLLWLVLVPSPHSPHPADPLEKQPSGQGKREHSDLEPTILSYLPLQIDCLFPLCPFYLQWTCRVGEEDAASGWVEHMQESVGGKHLLRHWAFSHHSRSTTDIPF